MRCSACKRALFVKDVYLQKKIQGVPSHVALYYRCGACGWQDCIVIDRKSWSSFEKVDEDKPSEDRAAYIALRTFQLDLDAVETVADLELYWKADKNPPRRDGIFCDCDECRRMSFGQQAYRPVD